MTPTPPNLPSFEREQQQPEKPSLASRIMALPDGSLIGAFILLMVLLWVCCPEPNDRGGMVRAKTSRARHELKGLADALASYRNDFGVYPATLSSLTTPTAYIVSMPADIWSDARSSPYHYHTNGESFLIGSFGPDSDEKTGGDLPWSDAEAMNALLEDETRLLPFSYDPSNGTFSEGDIWRIGTAPEESKP